MPRLASMTRVMAVSVMGVMVLAGGQAWAQPEGAPPAKQPEGEQPRRGRGPEGREGRPASVEGSMKAMNRALKALKDQVGDASKKEQNLSLVSTLQVACVTARGGKPGGPKMKAAKTEEAREALLTEYRKHLIGVGHALLELETQILEGKTDAAKASIEKIEKLRDEGHDLLGLNEGDEKGEKAEKPEKPEKPEKAERGGKPAKGH